MGDSWITTVGTSPFAVINPLWAAVDTGEWIPDRIVLVYTANTKRFLAEVSQTMERIVRSGGGAEELEVIPLEVDEGDLSAVHDTYMKAVRKEIEAGNRVAIDITPGRKYMSAYAMYSGIADEEGADRIYYALLTDFRYMHMPYPLIPIHCIKLRNILSPGGE